MTKYEFGRIERLQEELLYDDRDILSLHPYFEKHMEHMTSENLFGKCEIAAELAWRDKRIETMSDWQPIETFPNDGQDVLAWDKDMNKRIIIAGKGQKEVEYQLSVGVNLSHWMRIPPPKEDKDE